MLPRIRTRLLTQTSSLKRILNAILWYVLFDTLKVLKIWLVMCDGVWCAACCTVCSFVAIDIFRNKNTTTSCMLQKVAATSSELVRIIVNKNITVFTVLVPYILSNKKIDRLSVGGRLVACELAFLGACRCCCDLLASTLKSYGTNLASSEQATDNRSSSSSSSEHQRRRALLRPLTIPLTATAILPYRLRYKSLCRTHHRRISLKLSQFSTSILIVIRKTKSF